MYLQCRPFHCHIVYRYIGFGEFIRVFVGVCCVGRFRPFLWGDASTLQGEKRPAEAIEVPVILGERLGSLQSIEN